MVSLLLEQPLVQIRRKSRSWNVRYLHCHTTDSLRKGKRKRRQSKFLNQFILLLKGARHQILARTYNIYSTLDIFQIYQSPFELLINNFYSPTLVSNVIITLKRPTRGMLNSKLV